MSNLDLITNDIGVFHQVGEQSAEQVSELDGLLFGAEIAQAHLP